VLNEEREDRREKMGRCNRHRCLSGVEGGGEGREKRGNR